MKTNLLKCAACAVLILSVFNCSVEPIQQIEQFTVNTESIDETTCVGSQPIARIVNSGTVTVNFEIYNSNLELLNSETNVASEDTSSWLSFEEGNNTLFVVTFIDMKGEKIQQETELCTSIEFFVNSDNELSVNDVINL